MKRRTFVTVLAAFTLSLGASTASLAGEALDRIMESKTLKVATDANWPPNSFLNDQNEMDGFDVDVAREVAARLGAEVEFVTPQWNVITAGNWNGRWDISVGSMTPTAERSQVLSFPGIYYYSPAVFAVHEESDVATVEGLDGKRIAATQSSVYELYLQHDLTIDAEGVPPFEYQVMPGEIKAYESTTTGLDDMRLGNGVRVDAILASLPALQAAIDNDYPLKVIGDPVFYEPLAIAIDRGDEELNARIEGIVADMHADGKLSELSEKWFGLDYTKAVIN